VAGRWFGVRGRRFVRPTLTLLQKGAEVRSLADLEHKPWAAEDGEVWTAAFSVDKGLDGAREIELSVAPDIIIELRPKGKRLARPGDTLSAGAAARAPRFKAESAVPVPAAGDKATGGEAETAPAQRRRSSASAELERLGARLASANHALEQERERRTEQAKSIEDERTTNRQLRTELGQARSELEVAGAARAEAVAVEAELEEVRARLRENERRHEADAGALTQRHEEATQALGRRHEELAEAHAALEEELRQQTEALESTREALTTERAEAGRLRNRFAQLQGSSETATGRETTRQESTRHEAEPRQSPQREPAQRQADTRKSRQRQSTQREADPTETQRFDALGFQDELEVPSPSRPSRAASRRAGHQAPDPPGGTPPIAERLRPVNPSLRHRTWWFGRLLALIVLCGVIAAVYLVLHTTVLH
jgi:hypothetical protein